MKVSQGAEWKHSRRKSPMEHHRAAQGCEACETDVPSGVKQSSQSCAEGALCNFNPSRLLYCGSHRGCEQINFPDSFRLPRRGIAPQPIRKRG